MRLVLAAAFVAAVAGQSSAPAQPPQQAPSSRPPIPSVAPDVLRQFDYLDGEWDFTYTAEGPNLTPSI